MGKNSQDVLLERARVRIAGTLGHQDVQKKMSKYGYDAKKLQEGKALCEQISMLSTTQHDGFGGQKKATADFAQARKDIDSLYTYHRQVARLALREDQSMWDTLQLKGKRKKGIPQWLAQVQAFYNNIGRVAVQMEHRGVTEAELTQTKAMVEAAAAIRIRQAYNKSEKESAVELKKKLLYELQEWVRIYDYIAKVALKDNAQQLEAIGIVAH